MRSYTLKLKQTLNYWFEPVRLAQRLINQIVLKSKEVKRRVFYHLTWNEPVYSFTSLNIFVFYQGRY